MLGIIQKIVVLLYAFKVAGSLCSTCVQDLEKVFSNPDQINNLKMLDSWGKPSSGELELNLVSLGSYQECMSIGDSARYCYLKNISGNVDIEMNMYIMQVHLEGLGVCVPSSCNSVNVTHDIVAASSVLQSRVPLSLVLENNNVQAYCTVEESFSGGFYVVIVLIGIILSIGIGSSITVFCSNIKWSTTLSNNQDDGLGDDLQLEENLIVSHVSPKQDMKSDLLDILSVYANLKKLFHIKPSNKSGDGPDLSALHGIRVLSLTWVILGHSYYWTLNAVWGILLNLETNH